MPICCVAIVFGLGHVLQYTPCALILSALHLDHSDAPLSARQNLHFDTPSPHAACKIAGGSDNIFATCLGNAIAKGR